MSTAEPAFIPVTSVQLPPGADAAVLDVLRSGHLAQGEQVAAFEHEFAAMHGVEHAVAVSNGTTALVAALTALGIGPGDEVVTTPFSFVATVNAILAVGARPRFADIRTDDFALDPAAVDAAISPATAAILVVHLFGQCADMADLGGIASRRGLVLVEDAAQAHGASVDGVHAGAFGVGCFSFYGTKNLTTGEGGMVTTGDAEVAARLRRLRNHGMAARYEYVGMGHNWRMTDMAAALGRAQLPGYEQVVQRRARHAARLSAGLASLAEVVTPVELPGRRHVWHQYTVRLPGVDRSSVVAGLAERGVGSAVHYPGLLADLPHVVAMAGAAPPLPAARSLVDAVLSLPVHQHLADTDLDRILWASRNALRPTSR